MRETAHNVEPKQHPREGTEGFDDPALEAVFGLANPDDWIARARESEAAAVPLGRLGGYELLEEIGRGGQGVVYKAIQPGTGRVIAVKRLSAPNQAGTRHRARFAQETQALVRLRHPSIVTVLGAEEIAGSPTLVMEHVEGDPIDRWADAQRAASVSPAPILGVFAQVCDAVAHAHQRGVIHRDLKPSNILVDPSGVPRVLDFGIARLMDDLQGRPRDAVTVTCFAGTPAYASPEQLENAADADTRTDVYSLGALLYRLLAGIEPFSRDLSLPALMDAVRAGIVRRPSHVHAGCPEELDWVVLMAMQRDPALRYQTVDALTSDVRRFLAGRPVTAHPPSRLYAAAKFVRRNRLACSAMGAALTLIIALAAVSITQAVRLTHRNRSLVDAMNRETLARQYAESQTATQRRITEAVSRAVNEVATRIPRRPVMTSAEILACIEPEFAKMSEPDDPYARVQYHMLRANLAGAAGQVEDSIQHWLASVGAAEAIYGTNDARLAELRRLCGDALAAADRPGPAREMFVKAAAVTDLHEHTWALANLCDLQSAQGDFEGAASNAALLLAEAGSDHLGRANALDAAARVERARGQLIRARELFEQSLAELLAAGSDKSYNAARLRVEVASLLLAEGRPEDAEPLARDAAKLRMARSGPLYAQTERALLTHAEALLQLGEFSRAAERLEQAVPRIEAIHGTGSTRMAAHRFKVAAAHLGAGARVEGRRNLALALSLGRRSDPDRESLRDDVEACESVLSAHGWRVDATLAPALGSLAWLVDEASDPSGTASRPAIDNPDAPDDAP